MNMEGHAVVGSRECSAFQMILQDNLTSRYVNICLVLHGAFILFLGVHQVDLRNGL